MMRLIDADKLPKYTGYALSANEVAMAVENAPTVDAVEVVRCRECKWWRGPIYGNRCSYHSGPNHTEFYDADEFCSRGERKGGDADG